jgi:hypothetical protein
MDSWRSNCSHAAAYLPSLVPARCKTHIYPTTDTDTETDTQRDTDRQTLTHTYIHTHTEA